MLCLAATLISVSVHATATLVGGAGMAELKAAIDAQRAKIDAIRVRCSTSAQDPAPRTLTKQSHEVVSDSEGRFHAVRYSRSAMRPDGEEINNDLHTISATNLAKSVTIDERTQTASVAVGIADSARTCNVEWYLLNLYNPGLKDEPPMLATDLALLAGHPFSRLRSEHEDVQGVACTVLEAATGPGAPPGIVVWMDPKRGHVVMRWRYHSVDGPVIEYESTSILALDDGIWFSGAGTKRVFVKYEDMNKNWTIKLEGAGGDSGIEINPPIDKGQFTPEIPSGFWVRDLTAGTRYQQP